MYHPTRGGVRGGRDQFKWDDVKTDKDRENYLGHSVKAPVGRWQKGKDLFWYAKDNKSKNSDDVLKEEIRRVKEEEEQAMREALGLAPKRVKRVEASKLDKHEYAELVKRGSAAEDLGAGHAEAAQVQGLGLYKPVRGEESNSVQAQVEEKRSESPPPIKVENSHKEEEKEEKREKKRHREEREGKRHREEREERRNHKKHSDYDRKREDKHDKREKRRGTEKKSRHDSD